MGLVPDGLDVRYLGHRRGPLSVNGRLNIHWATLQPLPSLIDYLLVHELAHIVHSQHTPAFSGRSNAGAAPAAIVGRGHGTSGPAPLRRAPRSRRGGA